MHWGYSAMKMERLKVENFKGLRDVEIPLSKFVCLIGENNTGKSSILQAISLFISGSSLKEQDYFDSSKQIRIEITLSEISNSDLDRLADQHRPRIKEIIENGKLTLVRVYDSTGKSRLMYRTLVPIDEKYKDGFVNEFVKGGKPGREFVELILDKYPDLKDKMTVKTNQTQVKGLIQELALSLPLDQKELSDVPLPTGIDKSVSNLMPEPIYIQAVKDLSDETKTKEGTPLGKILGILLVAIEDQLSEEKGYFEGLKRKLNRIVLEDGTVQDDRLSHVKIIESTVEQYIQESFTDATLRIDIPPPELKTILSGAKIFVNGGVEGIIDSKGDGLRRATVFSILRSYAKLGRDPRFQKEQDAIQQRGKYLLLFEEPELYLYPKAQKILFDALNTFSKDHFVVVSTHSPMFLGPEATATFVKLTKELNYSVAPNPYTKEYAVALNDVNAKDQFQLICYENNNAAFFSETIVLVEGDSDYIVFPHIACQINPDWDCGRLSINFARINGKSSIRRYRRFFERFNVRVAIIADLDIILKDFDQLDPSPELELTRQNLIPQIDDIIEASGEQPELSGKRLKKSQGRADWRILWQRAKDTYGSFQAGKAEFDMLSSAVDDFFAWERHDKRLEVLANCTDSNFIKAKRQLLLDLRKEDVYVLEKGSIEDYYPEKVVGRDKPSKAQCLCNVVSDKNKILSLCSDIPCDKDGEEKKEFEVIFEGIFKQ